MAVLHIILPLALLEVVSQCTSLPEETFVQVPSNLEDEDSYFYMDTRSESDPKQSETRRRSTLDKNFARFGRGDLSPLTSPNFNTYDYDTPPEENYVPRPSRSGGGSKSDHFVRFGRGGNSDFVRFGRDPYRVVSRADQHFIRFGRAKPRNKREAVEKRPSGSNFVRFGRNDNFMRFGRQPEQTGDEGVKQQRQSNYKEEYLMRLLLEYLTRPQQTSRLA